MNAASQTAVVQVSKRMTRSNAPECSRRTKLGICWTVNWNPPCSWMNRRVSVPEIGRAPRGELGVTPVRVLETADEKPNAVLGEATEIAPLGIDDSHCCNPRL